MTRVNVHDAKTNLSKYLERVSRGESIVLCRRNVPIAELRPLPAIRTEPRPIGLAEGTFEVPEEFFEPLPSELLSGFETGDGSLLEVAETPTAEWQKQHPGDEE